MKKRMKLKANAYENNAVISCRNIPGSEMLTTSSGKVFALADEWKALIRWLRLVFTLDVSYIFGSRVCGMAGLQHYIVRS